MVKALEDMESTTAIRAMLEFSSKTLVMGQKVCNIIQKELRNGDKSKLMEDLSLLQAKYDEDKAAWAKKEKALENENK